MKSQVFESDCCQHFVPVTTFGDALSIAGSTAYILIFTQIAMNVLIRNISTTNYSRFLQ